MKATARPQLKSPHATLTFTHEGRAFGVALLELDQMISFADTPSEIARPAYIRGMIRTKSGALVPVFDFQGLSAGSAAPKLGEQLGLLVVSMSVDTIEPCSMALVVPLTENGVRLPSELLQMSGWRGQN